MTMIQNIKTVNAKHRCKVRVMNHSGDDILTTFDNDVATTCVEATETIQDFVKECLEKNRYKATVFGRRVGAPDFDLIRFPVDEPDFDLSLFEEVLIQPAPLVGG
jgi:hypothetical protein